MLNLRGKLWVITKELSLGWVFGIGREIEYDCIMKPQVEEREKAKEVHSMPEVVTLGETMMVFDGEPGRKLRYSHMFECHTGGAETNTAVALTRLGHSAGWISKLGSDEFGYRILNQFRGEGVDVNHVVISEEYPTGVFFRQRLDNGESRNFYYRKGSAAASMTPDILDREYIKNAGILFISGITPAISESAAKTVEAAMKMAKEEHVLVAFDPNLRLKVWSLEEAKKTIDRLMHYVDIALPGVEEGELLYDTDDTDRIAEIIQKYGTHSVFVKVGAEGCIGYYGTQKAVGKGFQAPKVVDTFGAGDGFAAGILAGILEDLSIEETMALGNAVGALTVSMKGNIEAYPMRSHVEGFIHGVKETNR